VHDLVEVQVFLQAFSFKIERIARKILAKYLRILGFSRGSGFHLAALFVLTSVA
jgi:hypothetical protein